LGEKKLLDTRFEWKKRVLDLGHYAKISLDEAIALKLNTLVLDEANLNRPLSISLIIPTKIDIENEEARKFELKVLGEVLSECSKLVDLGYLDEIVVIDGSRDTQGRPSYTVLEKVVATAYEELGLFNEQIKMLNGWKSERIKAKKGFFDFVLKVVNQFDENMGKVLATYGAFNVAGRFGVPPGKGAGIWLSTPVTSGDVICFVDSDIKGFKKELVVGLCHPIIYTKTVKDSAIKYVKAYYHRLTTRLSDKSDVTKLGGRVTRVLAKPLLKVIAKHFNIFEGIETFRYPLSGEAALSRDVLEMLRIPYHYGIEISTLLQLCETIGVIPLAQIDLGLFQHIGQSLTGLWKMSEQIIMTLKDHLHSHGIDFSQEDLLETILSEYKITAKEMLEADMNTVETLQKKFEKSTDQKFVFSSEEEMERVNKFTEIIRATLTKTWLESEGKMLYLPPWRMVEKETNAYFQIREMLKRRSIQSTWSRIQAVGLI
jgi:hypothetical protein